MDIRPWIAYFIALLELLLGLFILFRHKGNPINTSFFVLTLGVVLWIVSTSTLDLINIDSQKEAIFWYNLAHIGGAVLISGFLYFAWVFPYRMFFITWPRKLIIYVPCLFFIVLVLTTRLVIADVVKYSWGYDVRPGSLYGLYALFFIGFFVWGFFELLRKYRRSDGMHVWQLKYVLISVLIPFLVGATTDIVIPWLGINRGYLTLHLGAFATAVWLGLTAYVLFKKKVP